MNVKLSEQVLSVKVDVKLEYLFRSVPITITITSTVNVNKDSTRVTMVVFSMDSSLDLISASMKQENTKKLFRQLIRFGI